jgi:hypothetical protein
MSTAVLAEIATTLAHMERAPRMFGSPEAVEFQALSLVQTRQILLRPRALAANPHETTDAWNAFVSAVNGDAYNSYLFVLLREEGMLAEHGQLLGDAARWIAKEYPPEASAAPCQPPAPCAAELPPFTDPTRWIHAGGGPRTACGIAVAGHRATADYATITCPDCLYVGKRMMGIRSPYDARATPDLLAGVLQVVLWPRLRERLHPGTPSMSCAPGGCQ